MISERNNAYWMLIGIVCLTVMLLTTSHLSFYITLVAFLLIQIPIFLSFYKKVAKAPTVIKFSHGTNVVIANIIIAFVQLLFAAIITALVMFIKWLL